MAATVVSTPAIPARTVVVGVPTVQTTPSPAALAAGAVGAAALLGAAAYYARRRKTTAPAAPASSSVVSEEKKAPASLASAQAGPTARIVAIASAFPPNQYPQRVYHEQFKAKIPDLTPADADFVDRVFTGTGFDTCSSYLAKEDLFRKFTRTEYTKYVKASLKDMAMRASTEAIAQWGGDKQSITHIVFGTMTGTIHAPTLDIEIAREVEYGGLGLQVGIKRLNVEGMGCLTGYRCLGLANDIARADPRNCVLLIVCDIRSALGNQLSTYAAGTRAFKSDVIASSLFRDSGAAAIITSEALGHRKATVASKGSTAPLYEILDHRSALIPGSFDLVKYHEKDNAVIFLDIAKELPEKIKEVLKGKVEGLLAPHGIAMEDCTYSVHTGGPKVLKYVAESLSISKGRMASSWYCMKRWGNLSGSSNLVVLDHWRKLPALVGDIKPESKKFVVCMSFGPGVGMELLLLKVTSPEVGAEGV